MNTPSIPASGESLMAALRLWQASIDAELISAGFAFMADAQGQLLHLIGPGSTPEAELETHSFPLSELAAALESLIRSGALIRETDPARTLRLTDLGQRGLRAQKQAIENSKPAFSDSLSESRSKNFHELIHLLQDHPEE